MTAPCLTCQHYLAERGAVIGRAIARTARRRGIASSALAVAYMAGVHDRHEAGHGLEAAGC